MTKREAKTLLFALVIFIGIGYAAIRSGLNINGITHVNSVNWDVHFENYQVTANNNVTPTSAPVIGNKTTTVSYDVTLTDPGDIYEFNLDTVNAGSIDVMIDSFSSKLNGVEITPSTLPGYLNYSATYDDGIAFQNKQQLLHNTSEKIKLSLGYRNDIPSSSLPTTPQNLSIEFTITYVQADNSAIPVRGGPESFATDSWDTIIEAIQNDNTSLYHVGDTKSIDMGSLGTHTIRIANKSTPSECSTGGFSTTACGFVIEFTDLLDKQVFYSSRDNNVGWTNSTIRTYVNTNIYNELPSLVKNAIIDTNVVSGYGKDGSSNYTTTDKLYLLSTKEIYGTNISGRDTVSNTRQLDYYSDQGTTTSSHTAAIKKEGSIAKVWWLRSADNDDKKDFLHVTIAGDYGDSNANNENYISPAFRLG